MVCFVDNVGYWTDNPIDVGDEIRASDGGGYQGINEIKDYVAAIYVDQGLNWPGNARFGACGGAGFDGAAPVSWDLAPEDTVYQTPAQHPQSEFQEIRDKLNYAWDELCCTTYCASDNSSDYAHHCAADDLGDYGTHDTGDDIVDRGTHYDGHFAVHFDTHYGDHHPADYVVHYETNQATEYGTHQTTHEGTYRDTHYLTHNPGYNSGYDSSDEGTDEGSYNSGYDGTYQLSFDATDEGTYRSTHDGSYKNDDKVSVNDGV